MGSLLDDIEKSLLDGNIEVFKNLLMTELSKRDTKINDLIIELTYTKNRLEALERKQQSSLNRNELDYRINELHQIFKYRYEN